jgi:hypothetical protein
MTVVPACEKVELMMATSPLFVVRDTSRRHPCSARLGVLEVVLVSSTHPARAAMATSAAVKVSRLFNSSLLRLGQQLLVGTITTDS